MTPDEARSNFPITQHYNFMNHAAVAPLSGPAAEAMVGYAREMTEAAYLRGTYYRAAERVRSSSAKLINADPMELTFIKNTSEGINFIANGVQWLTGDNVVSTGMEFPANVYPWMNLEQRGVSLKRVAEVDGRIPFDKLVSAIDRRTRVVAVSAVQWSNGFRLDLTRLGEVCQAKGVLFFVDAIQALGIHPIDVRSMNIDFLAADGHKWLCGPEGAGIFYCRKELIGHIKPSVLGYMCMQKPYDAPTTEMDFHDDARRFDSGVYNLCGICGLGASIDLFLEYGVENIQVRLKHLTDMLAEGVASKGWQVHSPRTASEWSGIVAMSSDKHDHDAVRKHLRSEFKIVVACRLGRLRASPHFYTSEDEIGQLIEALPAH